MSYGPPIVPAYATSAQRQARVTINLAWRDGDDVFLVADTALTYPYGGTPRGTVSAVGELQKPGRNRVEESGAKVVPLTATVAATYADDSQTAVSALVALRDALESGRPIRVCLDAVARTFQKGPRFQLLIAAQSGDRSELWLVDPCHPSVALREIYEDRAPVILGSLPAVWRAHVAETVAFLYEQPDLAQSPARMLASTIMALQAMGQRAYLPKIHAGGTFFGVRLSAGRIVYQEDIVYDLFRRAHFGPPEQAPDLPVGLFSGIRDGLLIASSSLIGRTKAFTTSVNRMPDIEIDALLKAFIDEHHGQVPTVANHYGFIDRETGALVQVNCPSKVPKRYLSVENGRLLITEELFRLLVLLPEVKDGVLPDAIPHLFLTE